MGWREEFGDDYEVPKWFDDHPDLEDTSWKNDVSPSFETGTDHPDYPENPRVRIWVEHRQPHLREIPSRHRYFVQLEGEYQGDDGEQWYCLDTHVIETDDLKLVDCALLWAQDQIAQHGTRLCRDDDPLYSQDDQLFDERGRPNFPGVTPLPPPCAAEAKGPSGEVARALAEINRLRASIGLSPLDPKAAGWTDQDVIEEAARIRLKNRLMPP